MAALKMLRSGADEFATSLFADDGTTLRELQGHPSVVRILRSGEWNGQPFHLLEYVPHVNEGGRPSKAERIRHLAEIRDGQSAAHERGVVHRDVHPSKFRRAGEGHWKLIDWGIAFRPDSILRSQPDRFMPTDCSDSQLTDTLGTTARWSPQSSNPMFRDLAYRLAIQAIP